MCKVGLAVGKTDSCSTRLSADEEADTQSEGASGGRDADLASAGRAATGGSSGDASRGGNSSNRASRDGSGSASHRLVDRGTAGVKFASAGGEQEAKWRQERGSTYAEAAACGLDIGLARTLSMRWTTPFL